MSLRLCLVRFLCREAFSHGVPFAREFVGVVDQAIEDRVGQRGIANGLMTMLARKLAGDNRRPSAEVIKARPFSLRNLDNPPADIVARGGKGCLPEVAALKCVLYFYTPRSTKHVQNL